MRSLWPKHTNEIVSCSPRLSGLRKRVVKRQVPNGSLRFPGVTAVPTAPGSNDLEAGCFNTWTKVVQVKICC
jgi:hypothetical protein